MAEFNPDLHAFLMENEMCMWAEKGELHFGVHVHFNDIGDLIKILGSYSLDDGGLECVLNNEYTLYVPLQDHFMNSDYTVGYYKYCFNEQDLKRYSTEIEAFDNE
ncbi:hypothetical protein [Lysinibacillus sp. Bpr_S20]|uniref:hypothetical protein n=1 Tax=Lysinibacillus sp. Bpr_S20 TaxID=2933964 RepID=UPI002012B974|nr:hypothetical protein [Lysinibacillus sp. Bpr_S20]MCL1700798.1 hypothetical protein [Lysinibacillus sp. Bpr_S20]